MPKLPAPDEVARLGHMLEGSRKATRYLAGRQRADLDTDTMLSDAVCRALEIIGEAAKNVSPELKDAHPEVPWRDIQRARDFYAHAYFAINHNRVWNMVQNDLPPLILQLEAILSGTGGPVP